MKASFSISNLSKDFPASIVVFLVALPLCLGIALASGAPLLSGIIAGIVGGIIVASISGSSLGVSGPAAGLAVIVFNAIQELQSFEVFLCTVVLAGVIQIILGLLRAGVIGYYFPTSVIKGMLTGIGITIAMKQFGNAVGYVATEEGGALAFSNITIGAVVVCLVSLTMLILWGRPFMQKFKVMAQVPAPLLVVIFGIIYYLFTKGNATFGILDGELNNQLVQIPIIHSWEEFTATFHFPDVSALTNPKVYTIAFTMAIVASLETLLSVEATDKMDPQKRITPTNRELIAQGTGNIVSGLIGGLPITQVIIRSSANINSGAVSKLSAIFHGFLLLACVLAIPQILDYIPLACLAAILLQVGYKLAKPESFKMMYAKGWSTFLPFIVTILGVVFTDLLIGIGLGLLVSLIDFAYKGIKSSIKVVQKDEAGHGPITIELSHHISFLKKAQIKKALNQLPENSEVIIDTSQCENIHDDVTEMLERFIKEESKEKNIRAKWASSEIKEEDMSLGYA